MRDVPRLGFLGVGWIGRHRMEAVAKSGLAEVAALSDPSEAALAEARKAAPDAVVAPSYERMLDLDLDGVVVATPNALHAEQCVAALDRGMAVFCQKPLARDAEETRRVVDAARRAGRLVGVDLSYRHTAAMEAVRAQVASGALGRVHAADLVFHNAYGPDKGWFYDRRLSGGGCFMDLGIHLVDLALWTLGFPKVERVEAALHARGVPLARAGDAVEDYAVATLRLQGDRVVRLACSWKLHAGRDCAIEAAFHGTEGGAAMRNVGGSFYDLEATLHRGTRSETLASPPDAWGGRGIVRWAERLGQGARFDPEAARLVEVADVLDRVYRACGS